MYQEVRAVPEHTLRAAYEGCGTEGRSGVPAVVYDGGAIGEAGELKDGMQAKVKALSMYRGVMRPYPHPRSEA